MVAPTSDRLGSAAAHRLHFTTCERPCCAQEVRRQIRKWPGCRKTWLAQCAVISSSVLCYRLTVQVKPGCFSWFLCNHNGLERLDYTLVNLKARKTAFCIAAADPRLASAAAWLTAGELVLCTVIEGV
jgi:hypothetical protein